MKRADFERELWRHGFYYLDEAKNGVQGLYIGKNPESSPTWHIPFWGIAKAESYSAIMQGRDVKHMTRVVGYYSMTENWNPSKLGELEDRRKGDYSVTNTDTGKYMISRMKRKKEKQALAQGVA